MSSASIPRSLSPRPDGAVAAAPDLYDLVPNRTPPAVAGRLSSQSLLGGQREIEIDHDGAIYRLRLTSLGKLILTK